jgi:hypothetical protein
MWVSNLDSKSESLSKSDSKKESESESLCKPPPPRWSLIRSLSQFQVEITV